MEQHAVFATYANGDRVRVTDPTTWDGAQSAWKKLDDARCAHRFPQVRFFCVRSMDDTDWMESPVHVVQACLVGRGYGKVEDAAREAWKKWHPTFRSAWDKRGSDPQARTGVQGTGGWFYYSNGVTAAQGLRNLADVCRRRGLIQRGIDGRWYVTDSHFDGDTVAIAGKTVAPSSPRPGVFDMRKQLGRAPTAQEYRDARG